MYLKHNLVVAVLALAFLVQPTASFAQHSTALTGSRNDFKLTLLSLGSGSTRITYEHAFNIHNSAEATVGIIGMGWDWMNHSDPAGVLFKFAYKWRLIPQLGSDSWLAGFYVKPELVFAGFRQKWKYQDRWDEIPKDPCLTRQLALLAECGYQLVAGWFVFDGYCGLGPSFGTGNDYNYYHSFMLFPSDGWLAFTAGFRVGVAF